MMNLNNRGVSLVEMLAVVVILGMLIMMLMPNITHLINKGENESYDNLKNSIISAAKLYISDYKYELSIDSNGNVNGQGITNNKLPISILVNEGNIETTRDGNIKNPKNNNQCLNLDNSYIQITFNSSNKDFIYNEPNLDDFWSESYCN